MSDRLAGQYQPQSDTKSAMAGQWLPIARAALLLGIPERTLRRRVEAGEYETSRGRKGALILVPALTTNGMPFSHHVTPPESDIGEPQDGLADHTLPVSDSMSDSTLAAITVLERAVEAIERSLAAERQRADEEREKRSKAEQTLALYQERNRNLEAEVQRLSAQLALPEPTPEPTSPPDPIEALRSQVEQLQARLEAPRAPWWQFWRRGSP